MNQTAITLRNQLPLLHSLKLNCFIFNFISPAVKLAQRLPVLVRLEVIYSFGWQKGNHLLICHNQHLPVFQRFTQLNYNLRYIVWDWVKWSLGCRWTSGWNLPIRFPGGRHASNIRSIRKGDSFSGPSLSPILIPSPILDSPVLGSPPLGSGPKHPWGLSDISVFEDSHL